MTDLRRYMPQTGALTSRRWPNWSTVPNSAAGTPSRSTDSVGTIQWWACFHTRQMRGTPTPAWMVVINLWEVGANIAGAVVAEDSGPFVRASVQTRRAPRRAGRTRR